MLYDARVKESRLDKDYKRTMALKDKDIALEVARKEANIADTSKKDKEIELKDKEIELEVTKKDKEIEAIMAKKEVSTHETEQVRIRAQIEIDREKQILAIRAAPTPTAPVAVVIPSTTTNTPTWTIAEVAQFYNMLDEFPDTKAQDRILINAGKYARQKYHLAALTNKRQDYRNVQQHVLQYQEDAMSQLQQSISDAIIDEKHRALHALPVSGNNMTIESYWNRVT